MEAGVQDWIEDSFLLPSIFLKDDQETTAERGLIGDRVLMVLSAQGGD